MRDIFWPVVFLLGAAIMGVPFSLMALSRGAPPLVAVLVGAFNGFLGAYIITLILLAFIDRLRKRRKTPRRRHHCDASAPA
jgi:xanthosine utilization system XapX-like protein